MRKSTICAGVIKLKGSELNNCDDRGSVAKQTQEAASRKLSDDSMLMAFGKGFIHEVAQPFRGAAQLAGLKEPDKLRRQESSGVAYTVGAFAGQAADFMVATAIARRIPGCANSLLAATVGGGMLGFVAPVTASENTLADRLRKGLVGAATVAVMETTGSRSMRFPSTTGLLHHVLHESLSGAVAGAASVELDSKFKTGQWAGGNATIEAALGWGITGGAATIFSTGLSKFLEKGARVLPDVSLKHEPGRAVMEITGVLDRSLLPSTERASGAISARVGELGIDQQRVGLMASEAVSAVEVVVGKASYTPSELTLGRRDINLMEDRSRMIEAVYSKKEAIFEAIEKAAVEKEFLVHKITGCSTEICVAAELVPELQAIRKHRELISTHFDADANHFHRMMDSAVPGYASVILPEQVPLFLNQLPNPGLVKEIYLLSQKSADGTLAYALSPNKIVAWEFNRRPQSDFRWVLGHEWAHLADFHGSWKSMFDLAAKIEEHGYSANDYAKKNTKENWAVHLGEELINSDPDRAYCLATAAPYRAFILARALKEQIAANGSRFANPNNAAFSKRADYVEILAEQSIKENLSGLISANRFERVAERVDFVRSLAEKREDLAEKLIRRQLAESWVPVEERAAQEPLSKLLGKMHRQLEIAHFRETVKSSIPALAIKGIEELVQRKAPAVTIQDSLEQVALRGGQFTQKALELMESKKLDASHLPTEAIKSLVLYADDDVTASRGLSILFAQRKDVLEQGSPIERELLFERAREIIRTSAHGERKLMHWMYDKHASWMASPSKGMTDFLIEQLNAGTSLSDSAMLIVSHVRDPEVRLEALKVIRKSIDVRLRKEDSFGLWLYVLTRDLSPTARHETVVEVLNQQTPERRRKLFFQTLRHAIDSDRPWIADAFRTSKRKNPAA